jgi:hypothetical protein
MDAAPGTAPTGRPGLAAGLRPVTWLAIIARAVVEDPGPALVVVAVAAAARWPSRAAVLPLARPTIASGKPSRPFLAVAVTPVAPVPAATPTAAGPFSELFLVL